MKVLIVDDSDVMRRILRNAFTKAGFQTAEAEDATDALVFLERNMVDLIMMDVNLPDMTGLECLRLIRAQERLKGIKVIVCTSDSQSSTVLEAVKSGANSYVVKPFTYEKIKGKLREMGIGE